MDNNNQTLHELEEAIRLNPEDATAYLSRGYAYHKKGEYDKAIEDFDNAVRLCPNYETDFINSHFVHGRVKAIKTVIELLDSVISSASPKSAVDFYYTGVRALFSNDGLIARRAFEIALRLGYEGHTKIERHLENLKNRR